MFWLYLLMLFAAPILLYRSSRVIGGFISQRQTRNKKPREALAKLYGWEIVTIGFDPYALQGTIDNYFVRLYWDYDYNRLSSRDRSKYEVWISNPRQIELSFHSNLFSPLFRKIKQGIFQNSSEKAFREKFKISGKSADIISDFVKHEDLIRNLLKTSGRTGGIKVEIQSDRIIVLELGVVSPIFNKNTAEMIIGVLVEIAKWVDNLPPKSA